VRKKIYILIACMFLINIIMPFTLTGKVEAAFKSISEYQVLPEDNELYIPISVQGTSNNGYLFNSEIWENPKYHLIVYGGYSDIRGNDLGFNDNLGTWEYRYLGYDLAGNPFSNTRFPNDAESSVPRADKNWVYEPWNAGLCEATKYSDDKRCEDEINRLADYLGWSPGNRGVFFKYGNVQSWATLLAPGSFRMWHDKSGNN